MAEWVEGGGFRRVVLAADTGREIIDLLHQRGLARITGHGEKFSISQPAVRQQPQVLLEADPVRAERGGSGSTG